ncbi:hypothetical protein ACFSRY_14045 [Pontibacter locisalis]|uniref:Uncharacterized protein n=1 Tax=Pontibacter locisalis TaxID=1719035 RepID=A0ABW5INL8_9BACT
MYNPNVLYDKLIELQARLEHANGYDYELTEEVTGRLHLYNQQHFQNSNYDDTLSSLDFENDYVKSTRKLRGLITTMLEEIELNGKNSDEHIRDINIKIKKLEEERNDFDKKKAQIEQELKRAQLAKLEVDQERTELLIQNEEVKQLQEDLRKEREKLINENNKFDEFKKKLEVSDKTIDFQTLAKQNRHIAIGWAVLAGILIISLLAILKNSISQQDSFSNIANSVYGGFNALDTLSTSTFDTLSTSSRSSDTLIVNNFKSNGSSVITKATLQQTYKTTLYFSFIKYIATTLLIYSLWIYGIVVSIKNYNAQMHNHVINVHKSNSLRSTLSLLDTARSDDGNDKLLLQATQAIFAHQNTGYNGQDSEAASPNLITNVVDSVSKKI